MLVTDHVPDHVPQYVATELIKVRRFGALRLCLLREARLQVVAPSQIAGLLSPRAEVHNLNLTPSERPRGRFGPAPDDVQNLRSGLPLEHESQRC